MQLKEKYDAVVFGDHIGGLLAAALVARLGLSVLILPLGKSLTTQISKQGDCLDPESNFLIGSVSHGDRAGLLGLCFERLGILNGEEQWIESSRVLPQILGLESRFSLTLENDAFECELEREFSESLISELELTDALRQSESSYVRFWNELPQRLSLPVSGAHIGSFKELRRALYKDARQIGLGKLWFDGRKKISNLKLIRENPEIAQALLGLSCGISPHPVADPKAADLLQMIALARTGASFRGGMTAFRDLLKRVAKRYGADFLTEFEGTFPLECRQLIIENGRLVAVVIADAEEKQVFRSQVNCGILGCSLAQAREKLDFKGRSWFKQLKQSPVPVGWRFTVAIRVDVAAIPPGMSERMIWKEKEAPALEIETSLPSDYGLNDVGSSGAYRMIFLRTLLPYKEESMSRDFQRVIAARMMRQLMRLVPFCDQHIVHIFPDFRTDSFYHEVSKIYQFDHLSEIPENLFLYSTEGVGASSGIEGLFLASEEAYPHLGSFGSCVAALESVAWLAHRSGLPGPFA